MEIIINPFKIGDKVSCIDPTGEGNIGLRYGQLYTINFVKGEMVKVKEFKSNYHHTRFKKFN